MKKSIPMITAVVVVGLLFSCSGLKTKTISYSAEGVALKGYLAYDKNIRGRRPGVLVVHEWWGHNEYVRKRARMLAELGYTALAVDMYGGGKVADHPKDAGAFAHQLWERMDVAKARFKAALEILKNQESVDPEHIAAIGYCFGGGIVLQMAREGFDIDGVVSFHGTLATDRPAGKEKVKARVLVAHGDDDAFVTAGQVEAFKKEMIAAGAHFRIVEYPGATHAFTNPESDNNARKFNMPIAYNAEADKKSWQEMQAFLQEIFGK